MGTITLTAGTFAGVVEGYARVGSSIGIQIGSISAELITGLTMDYLITSSTTKGIAFVGNQSPTLINQITVNGNVWLADGDGVYDSGSDTTSYTLIPAGGEFVVDGVYTVFFDEGAPEPDPSVFDFNVRDPGAAFNIKLTDVVGSSTGKVKVWTGSAWVEKPIKIWSGSAWVEKPLKYHNGSSFVLA
jgi:hypothetical protein